MAGGGGDGGFVMAGVESSVQGYRGVGDTLAHPIFRVTRCSAGGSVEDGGGADLMYGMPQHPLVALLARLVQLRAQVAGAGEVCPACAVPSISSWFCTVILSPTCTLCPTTYHHLQMIRLLPPFSAPPRPLDSP